MTNITTIKFCGRLAQSAALYQYDYGQRLVFQNIDLPQTYEVHFANDGDAETITMLGDVDGVLVPDELLLTGKNIKAYIYLHSGEDDGETEYCATIPVAVRPEPSDVEPTPVQQNIIEQAIAAMNAAQTEFDAMATADGAEAGKVLTAKTVEDDRVTEWEFTSGGGGGGGGTTDYTDLDNKPKINNVTLTGNKTTSDLGLFSGDYDDLTNKPTIPTKVSDLTNDAGYITSVPVSSVDGKTGAVTILPSGGTTGQVLKKSSGTDYAVEWGNGGADGITPTVTATTITGGHNVAFSYGSGDPRNTDFDVMNGSNGTDGTNGQDGYSPSASVTKSGSTATISITDKNGTTTAQVSDGQNGTNGTNGTDGITPTVTATTITGGHNVAFSYGTGDPRNTDFDVMNGAQGPAGPSGEATVETVSGTTPTITGVANTRYMCGEVSTISITPPQSGIIDVIFTSGSSVAVLTVPNTVKWPSGFDPTSLEANTTYELNIMDGVYGAVMEWT